MKLEKNRRPKRKTTHENEIFIFIELVNRV